MFVKLWAFYKRDWQLARARPFALFNAFFQIFAGLLPFFFIAKVMQGSAANSPLARYGGDYFRFVLLGIASSRFVSAALGGFKQIIVFERRHGTLEAILTTPTSLMGMTLGRTLWNLTSVTAQAALYLLVGSFFFHADLSQANWAASLPVIVLTVGTFLGLGMILAGFFLIWRESGPLEFLLGGGSRFLGGVYFPVGIFPGWLQRLAQYLPFTHSLEAIRKSLLEGTSLSVLGKEIAILGVFSALLIPTGWLFFRWALAYARRQGTLGFD